MCKHDWTTWEAKSRNEKKPSGWYHITWWERRCRICNVVETSGRNERYTGQ